MRRLAASTVLVVLLAAPAARALPVEPEPATPEEPPAPAKPGSPAATPAVEAPAPAPPPPVVPPAAPGTTPAPARPVADAEDEDTIEYEPPYGPVPVYFLEAISGTLHFGAGAVIAQLGGLVASNAGADPRPVSLAIRYAAGPFAAGWGASWVGDYNGRPGSYWAATGGAAVGEGLGAGALFLFPAYPSPAVELAIPAVLAGLGAAAGAIATGEEPPPLLPTGATLAGVRLEPRPDGATLTLAGSF